MSSETIRRLNRDEILGGALTVEHVFIKALDAEIPIRRLTSRQQAQVEAIATRGVKVRLGSGSTESAVALMNGKVPEDVDLSIDLEAQTMAEHESNVVACHYGIAFDKPLSLNEVEKIEPASAIKEIAAVIKQRSGITKGDVQRMAEFRANE